jgi:hypothetical protein
MAISHLFPGQLGLEARSQANGLVAHLVLPQHVSSGSSTLSCDFQHAPHFAFCFHADYQLFHDLSPASRATAAIGAMLRALGLLTLLACALADEFMDGMVQADGSSVEVGF